MKVLVLLTGVKSPYTVAGKDDLLSLGKRLGFTDDEMNIEEIS